MLLACKAVFAALLFTSVTGRNDDLFNYGSDTQTEGGRESFGQPDWMDVTCSDIEECVSAVFSESERR